MAKHVFTGVFIPANIWLSKELSPAEKMILGEVDALSKETGWCYAGRKHFTEWLHCTPQNVTYYVNNLERLGYLKVERSAGERSRMQIVNERFYLVGSQSSLPGSQSSLLVGSQSSLLGSQSSLPASYIQDKNKNKIQDKNNAGESDPLSPPFKKVGEIYPETFGLEAGKENPLHRGPGAVRVSITDPEFPGVTVVEELAPGPKTRNGRKSKTQEEIDLAGRVIEYLNKAAGRNFKTNTGDNAKGIIAQSRQGYTEAQMQKVIDFKIRQWGNDVQMREHLNPVTLFRPSNFERYLNAAELPPIKEHPKDQQPTGQPAKIRQL